MPGFLVQWRQKSFLGSKLKLGLRSIGSGQAGETAYTCVLKGRGRWWERVRNFLGGKNLSTWNVTWKKVLVIRVKVGSIEYNAMIVLRKYPSVLAGSWEGES